MCSLMKLESCFSGTQSKSSTCFESISLILVKSTVGDDTKKITMKPRIHTTDLLKMNKPL